MDQLGVADDVRQRAAKIVADRADVIFPGPSVLPWLLRQPFSCPVRAMSLGDFPVQQQPTKEIACVRIDGRHAALPARRALSGLRRESKRVCSEGSRKASL